MKNKKEIIMNLLNKHFEEAMFCIRSWDAWHVGTMGEDDFEYLDEEYFEEFADELIGVLKEYKKSRLKRRMSDALLSLVF